MLLHGLYSKGYIIFIAGMVWPCHREQCRLATCQYKNKIINASFVNTIRGDYVEEENAVCLC